VNSWPILDGIQASRWATFRLQWRHCSHRGRFPFRRRSHSPGSKRLPSAPAGRRDGEC